MQKRAEAGDFHRLLRVLRHFRFEARSVAPMRRVAANPAEPV